MTPPLDSSPQKLQTLGRMAGSIAHDFNNLLAIIEGYAHILQRQFSTDPAVSEKLQAILHATQRGASLTGRLVEFQQEKPDTKSCDLVALMRDNIVLLKPLLSSRVELIVHLPDGTARIPCHPDELTQAILGFALSARTRRAGQVTLAVTISHDRAILSFKDNSPNPIGEDKATADDLQQAFALVQRCGGMMDLYTYPQQGNEIVAMFPLVKEQVNPLQNKTILVVDDEEDLLPVLQDQLENLGLKVLKAANASSALLLQQNHSGVIDFLLTDVVMPGTDGVSLAEIMSHQSPQMGVVYMTGRPESRQYLSPVSDEALVVTKPLRPETLSTALQQALEKVRDL
jgi:two-component system cell cycle sensor histidine kinase/response regulator CckA